MPNRSAGGASLALVRMVRAVLSPDHAWQLYVGLGTLAIAGVYVFGNDDIRTWIPAAFAYAGAAAAAFGAWRNKAMHAGSWFGLALGVFLLGSGDLCWAILSPDGSFVPTPSIADAVYLSGYAASILALASLTWPRGSGTDWEALFDTVIASLGVGLLAWVFLIQPATARTSGLDMAGTLVTMAYPVLDVAMAILLLGMVFLPHRPRAVQFLYVALAAFLVSDLWYMRTTFAGTYVGGGLPDIGWFIGYVVWGAAGLHPSSRLVGRPDKAEPFPLSMLRVLSLVGSCLLAPAMLIYEWANGRVTDLPLIAGASVILIMLWAARLALTVEHLRRALNARAELEGRLREQAERDVLVELLNRASFMNRVRAALTAGDAMAVLFIDLDDFKVINDTCGHSGGDTVLIEIAHRVTGLLRPPDIAARLGGDEFGILLPGGDIAAAQSVAARILQNLARPMSVDGRAVHIEASIGISTGGPGKVAEDLIREADVADVPGQGPGQEPVRGLRGRHARQRHPADGPASGARAGDRRPAVHAPLPADRDDARRPGFRLRSSGPLAAPRPRPPVAGGIHRPRRGDRADRQPGPLAAPQACCEAAEWKERMGKPAPGVAVNVSALQVRHPSFASDIRSALEESGLDPDRLVIELTETILIEVGSATTLVAELNDIGVRIAIDDFGTGYSSLAYLAAYPVDVLKIDRSFVSRLETGPREARLISAIIALGTDLGLSVIAEGVETQEQLKLLMQHGCVMFQGYFFSRPMLGHDLVPLLAGSITRHEPFTKNLLVPLDRSA